MKNEAENLIVTDYNTVVGKDFKEITLEKFFKTLDRNIKSDLYGAYFDREKKCFVVKYDGELYMLKLDEYEISKYQLGEYSTLTARLKKIIDKQNKINESEEQVNKRIDNYNEMIKMAESGKIPNDEVRLAYIEHLKKNKRFKFKNIKNYFKNLKEDLEDSYNHADKIHLKIWPFNYHFLSSINYGLFLIAMVISFLVVVALATNVISSSQWFYLALTPFTINLIPIGIFLVCQVKKRFKKLSNFINKRKLINNKIKTLENMKTKSSFKSIGEKLLDELSNETEFESTQVILKTNVLNDINNLALKLKDININDRKRLLIKLKEIITYFDTEMEKIEKNPQQGLSVIGKENELKISINTMISDMQLEVSQILKKQLEQTQVKKEVNHVMSTIETAMEHTENGHAYQLKNK